MNAEKFLRSGDLNSCRQDLFIEIKQKPNDVKLRIFLFQLFCIEENWEKALIQLDIIKGLDDSTLAMVNTYEQLIASERMRERALKGEAPINIFGKDSDWSSHYLNALGLLNQGRVNESYSVIESGAELAPVVSGYINEVNKFEWLSDADLRFGPLIEVIINGGYYWLPTDSILEIQFEPIEDLRDLVWRPAHLTLRNKGKLIAFIPSRYPLNEDSTDIQKLARICEWFEPKEKYYIGKGQRVFLTDANEFSFFDIEKISFD